MPQTSNKAAKILKIKVRKNIYRMKKYLLGLTTLGAVVSAPAGLHGQEAGNFGQTQEQTAAGKKMSAEKTGDKLLAYNRMVEVNLGQEIENRADWFVDEFVKASSKHLTALKKATARGQKTSYVENNFFDIVYPSGHLSGRNNYCITAINRALIDANVFGDLNGALPEYKSEGGNAVECRRFVSYLERKGYRDCIRHGAINIKNLQIGDIVMTPRGGGRYHATIYIGNGVVRSFNNDGEWLLKKRSGIVIKTKAIAEKAITQKLEKQKLVNLQKGKRQIVPLQKAQKIMQFLYAGRNAGDRMVALLQDNDRGNLLASASIPAEKFSRRQLTEIRGR